MTGLPGLPPARARLFRGLGKAIGVPLLLATLLSASAGSVVRIRRGDTLSDIAKRYNTTVAALREVNRIPGNNVIQVGQSLRLPAGAIDSTAKPKIVQMPRVHTVAEGDTLIELAARYRTSVSWLQARNRLPRSRIIVIGQRLVVGYTSKTAAVRAPARAPKPRAVPRSKLRALIRKEAKRAGVDPNLALALAYQESGFQHDIVSSAGAIGVMQVMPDTGRWMSRNVLQRPVDLADVEDNVVTGVRFLGLLIRMSGQTPAALAGYYQGLASVRVNGEYADTKAYVRNILSLQRRFRRG